MIGQKNKEHTIDINLIDPDGLKRTYTLATDYAMRQDPRWKLVDELYATGRAIEAHVLEHHIMDEYYDREKD